jgi:hypothetical protein
MHKTIGSIMFYDFRPVPDVKNDLGLPLTLLEMEIGLIRNEFDASLRNDLVVDGRQGVRGWKNVRLKQTVPG